MRKINTKFINLLRHTMYLQVDTVEYGQTSCQQSPCSSFLSSTEIDFLFHLENILLILYTANENCFIMVKAQRPKISMCKFTDSQPSEQNQKPIPPRQNVQLVENQHSKKDSPAKKNAGHTTKRERKCKSNNTAAAEPEFRNYVNAVRSSASFGARARKFGRTEQKKTRNSVTPRPAKHNIVGQLVNTLSRREFIKIDPRASRLYRRVVKLVTNRGWLVCQGARRSMALEAWDEGVLKFQDSSDELLFETCFLERLQFFVVFYCFTGRYKLHESVNQYCVKTINRIMRN